MKKYVLLGVVAARTRNQEPKYKFLFLYLEESHIDEVLLCSLAET